MNKKIKIIVLHSIVLAILLSQLSNANIIHDQDSFDDLNALSDELNHKKKQEPNDLM